MLSNSDAVASTKDIQQGLPCISEQIGLWEVSPSLYQSQPSDVDLASFLIRCHAFCSRNIHGTAHSLSGQFGTLSNTRGLIPVHLVNAYKTVHFFWQSLRVALDSWFPPPPTLVSYARLHSRGCVWHLVYLTSDCAQWRALCVVTKEHVELVQLLSDPEPVTSDCIPSIGSESVLLTEILREDSSVKSSPSGPEISCPKSPKSTLRQSTKWELSYPDPYPQWRFVSFTSHLSKPDQYSSLVAIGHSNGSIDVIDLLPVDRGPVGNGQTRIFIAPLCVHFSDDPRSSFYPIVHISFLDWNSLVVCHFSGHVDFWHLDWNARRFPARLMVRFSPEQLCSGQHRDVGPLTAADYDPHSKVLVLSRLYSRSSHQSNLPGRLSLHCFRVTSRPPFLEYLKPNRNHSKVSVAGTLLSKLSSTRTAAVRWFKNTIRYFYHPLPLELDAVAFLRSQSTRGGSVTAALQCSGTCSVWSLPRLDPLFILLSGPTSPSISPSVADATNVGNRPFRLTWWRAPAAAQTQPSPNNERTGNSDDRPQLVILRENGELNILQITDSEEVDKLVLTERQIHELNLSPNASFAHVNSHHFEHGARNILILDQKSTLDTLWKSTLYGAKGDVDRRLIRAVRLASTTPSELFHHLIMKGAYGEAIEFAECHHFDVELVYQRQWLDLSGQPSSVRDLPDLIGRTLNLIRHHPIWVLKQCLSFLPCTSSTEITISLSDFVLPMRCLLEHGLSRLSDISNEQLRSTASTQFSRLLFHLDCLQDIVTAEELEESSSFLAFEANDRCYLLRGLVEMLRVFRDHSLLDVAVGYAHSQRFLATKVLMRRLPVTVGRHRLAIASSLCETVDPAMYVNPLLDLHFPVGDEPQYAVRKELEADAVDRLYSSFSLQLNRDWMLTDELNASNYLRRITPWLMKRTYQMEARSGLVSHAVTLLEKGSELCLKLKAKATDWVDSAICLDQLDLLCWEFSQFSKVIYRQHKGSERNTIRSTVSVDSHHGRPITLARFSLSHFLSLSLEDRVDMLLQCSFPGGKSISSIGTPVSHSVLVEWGQLILYINRVLSGSEVFIKRRRKQLLTHALLRSAVHNGFHLHRMLVELISAGTVDEIFSLDERCAKFLQPSSRVMAPSDIDLLKAIVEVIPSFRLVADTGSGMADRSSSNTAELPALRAYLKEVTGLITATSQCLAGLLSSTTLDIEACKQLESLSKQLRVIDQCASAMSDLLSLGASLGRYQHVVVGLGIMSVGELVRCGHDSGEFQKLLAHWICLLAKSILGELSHPNLSPDQRVDEGASSAQLTEYFGRLQTIFNKAFVGCPAADWISVGLHYSLLTAGDERLFEVSRHLHLDSLSPLRRSEEQSPGWYVSLLHALRNYIDSSLPEPSISPESKVQDMELMEPNERMARRCLLAFRTLSSSSSSKLHLQDLFDLEESILNAFSFIASVNPLMPSDTQPPITAPFQLRPLWTRSPSSLKRRQSLFLTAVFTIMQSFRSSHTNRNKFLNLLKSDSLYAVGRYFLLSAFDAADCLVQATFKYLAEYGDHLLPAEILERTMDLLINVVSGSTQSTWYNCAQWATHYSLHDKHDSCGLVQVDTKWTVLHGLFRIPRPFEANTELDDRPRFVLLTIETLRLLLSRLAYVHCPSDHMDEMLRMVAICGHRLDCAFNTSGADDRLYLPEILRPLSDMLSGIITDRIPWHCSSEEVSKAADKGLLLPFAYLSALSHTPNVVSNRIRRSLSPCSKGDCQLSAFELNWWKLFLRCWVADAHSTFALTELLSNGPSAMDARLRFCYAHLEPKIAQLKLDSTLHTRLVDMYHCIWNCEPCDNVPSFQLVHPTSAERLRLALIVSSLGTNHSEILHAGACFPSGSHLVSSISMIESSNALSTSATTWLRQQCLSAVYACLCVRTIICVSPIDLDLFNTAKSSQLDVIRHISRTHLKLGIRLAVCAHMPLYEAFCARLDTLFLESSTSNTEAEIRRLMPWVLKAPDTHSRIIQWCSETIYPNLTDMYKLQILLDVLETEFQIAPPGDLPISIHRRIISLLKSNQSFMAELLDLPYAKLLNLLQSPMPYGLFRSHPLFEHLRTEPVLVTFSQILQLFPTGLESTLKSADLCAMYGLNVLSNSTSVANYRREHSSTLHSLLSGIAPSQDAIDLERLVRWTHQLVFGPYGNCLEVDQRRWILKEVLRFIDGQGSSVSARILSDLEQFNRVSDKLKNLDFPVMRDQEANTDTAESVIAASSFFGAFLTLTPQDDVSASLLFRRLIDHVNTGDDLSPNSTFSYPCMETATQNLHWFATHLPTCFDAVRISSQVEVQLIVYAIASLPLPVSSPLDDILVKISNHPEHTSKSDRDSLSSALIEFIRSCFDKPSTLDDHRNPLSLENVLSALLVNTHIRRLHGQFLWHHFSTDTLDLKAATVFSAAFRLLSDSSESCTETTPASVLQGKLNSLQPSLSTEQFFEDTLMPFFQSTIDEMSSEQSTEPDSESLASSYRCDLLQSIIELFTLLFRIDSSSDEFSQNSQLTSSSNSTDPATVLWELWFQFTLHAKLLPDPDGFLTSTLLLEQWVHYGLPPPRGLALASIRHLRKCLHSSSTQWPILLQATVLSACLFQQDINVVLEALPVVAICSPSVIALIDPDACRCFTCLHGPVWVSLVKTDKTSAFALDPCPTLFTHIFQTVECFVSQHKSSTQAHLLCSHCVKHLHSADLWIEAIRLSRALCDFPVNVITLDTLVHRVCAMLKR